MVHYHISSTQPSSHRIQIMLSFLPKSNKNILKLPVWRPGRYELADFSKNVYRIKASQNENSVSVKKVTKNEWLIITEDVENKIEVSYEYAAQTMDGGNSWVDENQWYINFINCMMEVNHLRNSNHIVSFTFPDNYKIACGLKQESDQLIASNYLELVDCPMIASPHLKHETFEEGNCVFHIWIQGNCQPNWVELKKQFKDYTKSQIELFGNFPCEEYHYLFQILPYKFYHGVEHRNSTTIVLGPDTEFLKPEFQNNLLGISSHELFHTWNITRIRPKELTPYNLFKEVYFDTGYVAEGVTTYYGDLMLVRSGVFSEEQYHKEINTLLKRHFYNDGRHELSLTESSIDLWVDGYKPGAPHRKVSIYVKGALVSLMLDLLIRKETESLESLDSVMTLMWSHFGDSEIGYTSADFQLFAEQVSGIKLDDFFKKYIYGNEPIEKLLDSLLRTMGCGIRETYSTDPIHKTYGMLLDSNKTVTQIAPSSPAFYGMMIGDQITQTVTTNDSLKLDFTRNGQSLERELKSIGQSFFKSYELYKLEAVTTEQKKAYMVWLETSFSL